MSGKYGLKDYLHYHQEESLKHFFGTLGHQRKYAWQRAWRNYDDTDLFDLFFNFTSRMPALLKEVKKNNDTLFRNLNHEDELTLTVEETDAILDEMIFYFENCNLDTVYRRIFGDKKLNECKRLNAIEDVSKENNCCWDMAMMLFYKWSSNLWY